MIELHELVKNMVGLNPLGEHVEDERIEDSKNYESVAVGVEGWDLLKRAEQHSLGEQRELQRTLATCQHFQREAFFMTQ